MQTNKDLFSEHIKRIDVLLQDYTPSLNSDTEYYAVIVEPRKIDEMVTIMKTVKYYLNETDSKIKWGLQIFHGLLNEKFIKENTNEWGEVIYENLNQNNLTNREYNDLLKTSEFWKKVRGKKILIFQSDSILLRTGIDEFLHYDYIGAPWIKPKENVYIGNGGLSLRTKETMISITTSYQDENEPQEDIFFITYLKENLPSIEIASQFSVEDVYYHNPLGIHLSKKLDSELFLKILNK